MRLLYLKKCAYIKYYTRYHIKYLTLVFRCKIYMQQGVTNILPNAKRINVYRIKIKWLLLLLNDNGYFVMLSQVNLKHREEKNMLV